MADSIEYATLDDLKQYGPVEDETRANAMLSSASAMVAALIERSGGNPISDYAIDVANRKTVVCMMSMRAMTDNGMGISQQSQTAGPYTWSNTFANPSGDLYLTKSEKQLLGIGRQTIHFPSPFNGVKE